MVEEVWWQFFNILSLSHNNVEDILNWLDNLLINYEVVILFLQAFYSSWSNSDAEKCGSMTRYEKQLDHGYNIKVWNVGM